MGRKLLEPGQYDLEQAIDANDPHAPLPGTETSPLFQHSIQATALDEHGREIPSPLPLAPPIGYQKTDPLHKRIAEMIRSERLAQEARSAGFETMEEADDFDIGDDYDPYSPYEHDFDVVDRYVPSPPPSPNAPPSAVGTVAPPPSRGSGTEPLEPGLPNQAPASRGAS